MDRLATMHVTIVGLGLMGGSLALALQGRVARLVAVDNSPDTRRMARRMGAADLVTGELATGIADADLVILAMPVRAILSMLSELRTLRPAGMQLLDLGSTKRAICAEMATLPPGFQALGGHPMCGKESAGLAAAEAGLYRDRTFVLSPVGNSPKEQIRATALELVTAIGAHPLFVEPGLHDEIVALTSHLPYLASALLMAQVAEGAADEPLVWPVSGTGLRDMTRLSGSDPDMMLDILATNHDTILAALRRYRRGLDILLSYLEGGDEASLRTWLIARHHERSAYEKSKG